MKRLGVVLAVVLLVAVPMAPSQAQEATEDPEITSSWNQYTSGAIAQGIAYQFTFDGDSLATGSAERWGGLVSGSLPYAYSLASDVRNGGIGSVFWPSYALTVWREGAPLLMDRIPFYGEKYPEQVATGVKLVADTVPFSYPLFVATNGSNDAEVTTVPATEVPGGSFAGATMRCGPGSVPESVSVRCQAQAANVQLGAPSGASAATMSTFRQALALARAQLGAVVSPAADGPTAAVSADSVAATADSILEKGAVRSLSSVTVKNLDILGAIRLGSIQAVATNVTDGATTDIKRTVTLAEATVAGQPVTIGRDGVSLAGNAAVSPAEYEKANQQLRDSLSAAGVTIRLFGGTEKKVSDGGGAREEGEALYIGLKLPNPGVPSQFFYLNYWLGATVNTTLGVPARDAG